MTKDEYLAAFTEDDSPGWMAIDAACAKIYGPGEPPGHFAPSLPPVLGGAGPDGISIYVADGHLHFVSYGFSTLHYDPEAAGGEFSGLGFELTFRLKSDAAKKEDFELWPASVMQNLYRYVTSSGRWFEPNQAIPTKDQPLCTDMSFDDTQITGLWLGEDPQLGMIDTPHGQVQFIQMVGMTRSEAEAFTNTQEECETALKRLSAASPLLVTDMKRGL